MIASIKDNRVCCCAGSVEGCHFFFAGFLCGVDGLPVWPVFIPPYWYLAFFSDGFKIYEKRRGYSAVNLTLH